MPLKEIFEFCSGSIAGTEHRRLWKNNQDALHLEVGANAIVGVVCDGCGSQAQSEIGAQLGSQWLANKLLLHLEDNQNLQLCLETVRQEILEGFRSLIACKLIIPDRIEETLLFSIMGFVITPQISAIFSLGDGVYALNGQIKQIGPFEDNAPPYLGYALFKDPPFPPESLKFLVLETLLTKDLQSLLVGSDGCQAFIEKSQSKIPGKDEALGSLIQFCADSRYFNGYLPNNRLKLANREKVQGDWDKQKLSIESGLLDDDTTFIALRRKEER